jgi:hypothetical protein
VAYTISAPTATTPTFSLAAGNYSSAQSVTLSDATAGATIYYTTNGTIPTTSSTKYAGAIAVSATETIEAIAVASGYTNSAVALAAYTISSGSGALLQIDAGSGAVSPFIADTDFNNGNVYSTHTAVSTTGVANAAPAAVYQSVRWAPSFTYIVPGLAAGSSYTVRLHFAELSWTAAGQCVFNVAINGTRVLSNFDIFAAIGEYKALVEQFTATADSLGQVTISFSKGTADNPEAAGRCGHRNGSVSRQRKSGFFE